MDVREAMHRLGGVARRSDLLRLVSARQLERGLRDGEVVRVRKGWYSLPILTESRSAALELNGVMSHLSAANAWGWAVKHSARRPSVVVPRKRTVPKDLQSRYDVHWVDLRPDEVYEGRTTRVRTVLDCAKTLPFDEALSVADSALRNGVPPRLLLAESDKLRGPGRARCLTVVRAADGRAANPFESCLRGIVLAVRGLDVEPQFEIRHGDFLARVDLADPSRRIAVEAEGFEWHGNRKALMRDCRRYTTLALLGWTVLRFTWEDVMLHPDYVRGCLEAAVASRPRRTAA